MTGEIDRFNFSSIKEENIEIKIRKVDYDKNNWKVNVANEGTKIEGKKLWESDLFLPTIGNHQTILKSNTN